MSLAKFFAPLLTCGLLTGCFLSTPTPFVTPELAEFPIDIPEGDTAELIRCQRDPEDFSDWSDCAGLSLQRNETQYLVTDPDEPEDAYAIRFTRFSHSAGTADGDYIFQVSNKDAKDGYTYGFAKPVDDKLFLAFADAKFVREATCLELGAEYPSVEKSCIAAIDSLFELMIAMRDISDAADYTLYIQLPDTEDAL